MALKIKVHEASPRKFRQDPSTRGVGGKYGPIGEDPLVGAGKARKDSLKSWQENGTHDEVVVSMIEDSLKKTSNVWELEDTYYYYKITIGFMCYDISSILGFDLYEVPVTTDILSKPDYSLTVDTNGGNPVERLLVRICNNIMENDNYGGAGVNLEFITSDGFDGYTSMRLFIDRPWLGYPNSPEFPTRKQYVDDILATINKVTAYLKKMAPVIKREMERTYNK